MSRAPQIVKEHTMLRFLTALLALALTAQAADGWPRFLGPNGNNTTAMKGLPLEWQEATDNKPARNLKWKVELPGEGWSSPVIGADRIYCTTALDEGHSLHALCIALADGKILWDVEVFKNAAPPPNHKRNSYASPTPLLEGDHLYVTFGTMGTACLAVKDGAKIWENRDLVWDQQNGPGGSMSGFGDLLLIPCDGADVQYEAALSKKDGRLVWKSERSAKPDLQNKPKDMHKAYGTPVVINVDGKPVSITMAAERLYALDPNTGRELWHIVTPGFSNVPLPVSDGRQIYISTGFNKGEMWGIKHASATGDATGTHVVWKQSKGATTESTPVVVGSRLYYVNSGGIATCLNTADGSVVWQQRLGPDFAATPLVADGRLYFFDTRSNCYVIEPGDTFRLLATNSLESGCMASPAVAGKAMIVRTKTHLYRIEDQP